MNKKYGKINVDRREPQYKWILRTRAGTVFVIELKMECFLKIRGNITGVKLLLGISPPVKAATSFGGWWRGLAARCFTIKSSIKLHIALNGQN